MFGMIRKSGFTGWVSIEYEGGLFKMYTKDSKYLDDYAIEIYSGAMAILFTGLGIWLALKLTKPKVLLVEPDAQSISANALAPRAQPDDSPHNGSSGFPLNEKELARLGLSPCELEVLQLMAGGLSNQEIADSLFLSLNTIKTHSSKIFEKLDVRRRTQAVNTAKKLNIIA
jgi:NarL family two-component system response regulator LiaR